MNSRTVTVVITPRPGRRFYSEKDWMITSVTPNLELSGFFRNRELNASYERAKAEVDAGKVRRFSNVEDLITDLNTT